MFWAESKTTLNHSNPSDAFDATRAIWDQAAAEFDLEADHGLAEPTTRAAWRGLLRQWLPDKPVRVLDLGCGTGSLSVLLAENGHSVTGIDFSDAMLQRARVKAKYYQQHIEFYSMDAGHPDFPAGAFDVVLCRHVLWVFKEPEQVLQRWAGLLGPTGRLILIEGYWMTGAGLHAETILSMLPTQFKQVQVHSLSDQSVLWGKVLTDERFAIVAR